jgi:catechol 2,3-dioxygenase-like lactoylglutathione lyase family enzyme
LPRARFHHIHINTTDPDASIRFYTTRFKSERATFGGSPALKVHNGWILFNTVSQPPPSEQVAASGTSAGARPR